MTTKPYWWAARPNAGDRLTPWILYRLERHIQHYAPADANLVVIGSILEHLPPKWTGTVCGAGLLKPTSRIDLTDATVLALRGKLTLARATGVAKDVVLGDPGLLVPKFTSHFAAKYDLGLVAHWSDTELVKRYPHAHVIDVTAHPEFVIGEIARCKAIISSSLHGIVIADAFGIPRQAELFAQAAREGGDFKFRDYASVYPGGDPHFGEMWRAPHDVVERLQDDLWVALHAALGMPLEPITPTVRPAARCTLGRRPRISLLVPFRDDGEHRTRVWHWLKRYWSYHLPDAEIVVGHDDRVPYSKAAAINDAASRARGRVFVIADADAYMDARHVRECADRIIHAVHHHRRLWFMPYTHLYRLTEPVTLAILQTDPHDSFDFPTPPPPDWIEPTNAASYGHRFGAMMQIMPREAFFLAGGFDPRHRGWGSEDACFMRAVDTLYAPHELAHNDILHLWHGRIGHSVATRKWVGQVAGTPNARLAQRYGAATAEPAFMRGLVDEHVQPTPWRPWRQWLSTLKGG